MEGPRENPHSHPMQVPPPRASRGLSSPQRPQHHAGVGRALPAAGRLTSALAARP